MNSKEDFFDITASDLYRKAEKDLNSFFEQPNDESLLNLLFTLNHLRDWICPEGYGSYRSKDEQELTEQEKFHCNLYNDAHYKTVQELCNRAKHFLVKKVSVNTVVKTGFIADISVAGDKLDQRVYIVNSQDIRPILKHVFDLYADFFDNKT